MVRNIKESDFGGLFYPSENSELNDLLDNLLEQENIESIEKPLKALIVPHAAYIYSGQCAAVAYKILEQQKRNFNKIYIFGPSHKDYFSGIRVTTKGYFTTPIGALQVNQEAVTDLIKKDLALYDDEAFFEEHSIEVQLPFIKKIFDNNITIIPCVIGETKPESLLKIIEAEDSIAIISADLSHFLDLDNQQKIDIDTIKAIEDLSTGNISNEQSCCSVGINACIKYAKENDLAIKNMSFQNSAEISPNKHNVVGYGAFVVY